MSALARGARRSQRRFGGALQPYVLMQAEFRPGRGELSHLERVSVERSFHGILQTLDAIGAAGAAMAVIRERLPDHEPEPFVFEAAVRFLGSASIDGAPAGRVPSLPSDPSPDDAWLSRQHSIDVLPVERFPKAGRSASFDAGRGGIVCRACGGGRLVLSSTALRRWEAVQATFEFPDDPWPNDERCQIHRRARSTRRLACDHCSARADRHGVRPVGGTLVSSGDASWPVELRAPHGAQRDGDRLVRWSARGIYPHEVLRGFCPCARCQGTRRADLVRRGRRSRARRHSNRGQLRVALGLGRRSPNRASTATEFLRRLCSCSSCCEEDPKIPHVLGVNRTGPLRPFALLPWERGDRVAFHALIVDDSSAVRAFVRASLEERGFARVEEAETGFEALRLLASNTFDVVIVDVNMPDINGLELLAFMKKSPRQQAVLDGFSSAPRSGRSTRNGASSSAPTPSCESRSMSTS